MSHEGSPKFLWPLATRPQDSVGVEPWVVFPIHAISWGATKGYCNEDPV